MPRGVGNAEGGGTDNIKTPGGPSQTPLPYHPLSISQWINSGFLDTFDVLTLEIRELAKPSPQEVAGNTVLGSHCSGWVYFLPQVCWSRKKTKNDSTRVRFSETCFFWVNSITSVTKNLVPAFISSKHKLVLFITNVKTKQKHSLIKSRENIVPKIFVYFST